jgi:hypothetical protein
VFADRSASVHLLVPCRGQRGAVQPRFQCYRREGLVRWRLLGRNNRSLARSTGGFVDLAAALADAEQVSAQAALAPVELECESGTAWRWVLMVDGVPRATSAIGYARRLECVRAVDRFRDAAGGAELADRPLVVRPAGAAPSGES